MNEKYVPSKEEMDAAKNAMTKSQESLSKIREYSDKFFKEKGVTGYLYQEAFMDPDGFTKISGVLNGRKIVLEQHPDATHPKDPSKIIYSGKITINGEDVELDNSTAHSLFYKYCDGVINPVYEKEDIRKVNDEMNREKLKEVLRELLGKI